MKQEEKNLLINDLCGRLSYGVKCQIDTGDADVYVDTLATITIDGCVCFMETIDTEDVLEFGYIKPLLFPMSSMTEEQLKEMQEIIGNPNEACISVNTYGLELWLNSIDTDPTIWLDTIFEVQDWLNKNNFDYRGLIPMGLAIDATGLNIY